MIVKLGEDINLMPGHVYKVEFLLNESSTYCLGIYIKCCQGNYGMKFNFKTLTLPNEGASPDIHEFFNLYWPFQAFHVSTYDLPLYVGEPFKSILFLKILKGEEKIYELVPANSKSNC